ncbi:hypothetical protein IKE71_00135 [Candidatus Saccharibacteria bacterium]|nr:hypothetical protein [Candidatus Saccharibacteria bacterium]
MIGQNSYLNNNPNSGAPGAIYSPAGNRGIPNSPNLPGRRNRFNKPVPLIIGGAVLLISIVAAVVVFLVLPALSPNPTTPTATISEDNKLSISGDKSTEEAKKQFDDVISSAKSTEEAMDATFAKIGFEIMSGEYETALSELSSINESNLSDFDQYRLHNYYTTAYTSLGNTKEAERHQTLASEAHERDLASFTLE